MKDQQKTHSQESIHKSNKELVIEIQPDEKTTGDHVLEFFQGFQDTSGIRDEMTVQSLRKTWNNFWSRFSQRFRNFFIESVLVPAHRPEWKKYNQWSYRYPPRPPSTQKQRTKRKCLKRRKKLIQQIKKIGSPGVLHNCKECSRITINVAGQRFQTQLRTLKQFPDTLLGDPSRRLRYYDPTKDEYYFERNRSCFYAILYWYQSGGQLNRPSSVPFDIFEQELLFFQIPDYVIEKLRDQGPTMESKKPLPKSVLQRKLWLLMEYPESSIQARIVAFLSICTILLAIVMFCIETLPTFSMKHHGSDITYVDVRDPFSIAETCCVIWFAFEIVIRCMVCPDKIKFLIHLENLVDVLAIIPYCIQIQEYLTDHKEHQVEKKSPTDIRGETTVTFLKVIRLVRIFRIFKLSRYSKGLRILGQTLKASITELSLLCFFLLIGVILFSTAMYYAEIHESEQKYESIVHAFWWAIVTMTTIGYGDVMPVGTLGKIVNALCAIAGVVVVALPVPVIVQNFNYYYYHYNQNDSKSNEDDLANNQHRQDNHILECPFRPTCGKKNSGNYQTLKSATPQDLEDLKYLFSEQYGDGNRSMMPAPTKKPAKMTLFNQKVDRKSSGAVKEKRISFNLPRPRPSKSID